MRAAIGVVLVMVAGPVWAGDAELRAAAECSRARAVEYALRSVDIPPRAIAMVAIDDCRRAWHAVALTEANPLSMGYLQDALAPAIERDVTRARLARPDIAIPAAPRARAY